MIPDELHALARSLRRHKLWTPGPNTQAVRNGREMIARYVPQAGPAVILDEITSVDFELQAVSATRHVAIDDPVFAWHFPGEPIYPAALLGEATGQTAFCALKLLAAGSCEIPPGARPLRSRLVRLYRADFLEAVLPGDSLIVLVRVLDVGSLTAIFAGQILRGDTVCMFSIAELLLLDD
jgi:3-hydroxymyristoyl/3-hydroxydecanoyl-(acyl carrier protein) dehydratase